MDVAFSTSKSMEKIQQQASLSVMKMAMNNEKEKSQGVVDMIKSSALERSVNPNVGGKFDVKV